MKQKKTKYFTDEMHKQIFVFPSITPKEGANRIETRSISKKVLQRNYSLPKYKI